MIQALATMTALGVGFGTILGIAARRFHVDSPAIVDEIEKILPGTNCGQCGFAGCRGAAEAVAAGDAPVTLCPPGGRDVAMQLVEVAGPECGGGVADLSSLAETEPMVAFVFEDHCTGCTKCFKRCPTDAIVGAAKQIHTVINDACTGCEACMEVCPTEAIILRSKPRTLRNWHWPKPGGTVGTAA
ncbi:RnfABCDGE type electron transport complex subunit B [Tropicimonas isoalkanivorans]|uniref:Ion-translocating oxidoreductase complex subunit B n=1 Tax=Tropicimonas isoalkanivorans TaxID=441112 RepID=A0A1I1H818_9RHOB|nr:RnfABCDGE type electron transport complex subunit B [Tropicimonas isoalkanivorans]SFC20094.1 electron transport complex protein RnfB [Tropicimonas isoalkanivorans]